MPAVSVVLPVLNGARFLGEAIDSILGQTFADIELIVVDGGSTDGSLPLVRRLADGDARIRLLEHPGLGLARSLNAGCLVAKGRYIARMDADDVSEPTRFAVQVAYLDSHPEVALVGSSFRDMDEDGNVGAVYEVSATPAAARWILFFGSSCAHPTVMMRKDVAARLGFYDVDARFSEDYDLWSRMAQTSEVSNVPASLLRRRVWSGNKGNRDALENEAFNAAVMHRVLSTSLPVQATATETASLRRLLGGGVPHEGRELLQAAKLLASMMDAYVLRYPMGREDRTYVTANGAQKLLFLARAAAPHSRLLAVRIASMAVRRHPAAINRTNLRKALKISPARTTAAVVGAS